jgi:hypothetical protein
VFVLIYGIYATYIGSILGSSTSFFPAFLFFPLLFSMTVSYLAPLILLIPYSYLLSCLIVLLYKKIKTKKLLLIILVVFFMILSGIDEPIVNYTINQPDDSCSIDSDCSVKSISKGGCPDYHCVNSEWEYYDSIVNNVFGLSCKVPTYVCSCVTNTCVSKDISDSLNVDDCDFFEENAKENCIQHIKYNIKKSENK